METIRVGHRGLSREFRQLAGFAASLLFVLLPVLAAGVAVGDEVSFEERARITAALDGASNDEAGPFRSLLAGVVERPDPGIDPESVDLDRAVLRTRLLSLALLFATSALTFLAVAVSLSKGLGALACLGLALSPAIREQGVILRPESLASAFAQLGLLVLLFVPKQIGATPSRAGPFRLPAVLSALTGGACYALSVASAPSQAAAFGVPVTCAVVAVARAGTGFVRVGQRTRFRLLPFRSFRRRTGPWTVAAATTLLASLTFLGSNPPLQSSGPGLFPSAWVPQAIGRTLVFAGLLAWLPALARQWGRSSRLSSGWVLFVHTFVLSSWAFLVDAGSDHRAIAPSVAILFAYGIGLITVLTGRRFVRRAPG